MTHVVSMLFTLIVASQASSTVAQPSAPAAAYSVGAAFDAHRSRLVVFGGYTGQYVGDTWTSDGSSWSRVPGRGPAPRNSPAMVFDAARRHIVMFGGDARPTGAFGDTWVFDDTGWKQVATSGPPARTTHHMVYDAARERVVLFGGVSGTRMLGDTWEWDGTRWTEVTAPGPAPRALAGMAYDSTRRRTVLFGGMSAMAPQAPSFSDTWEFDGTTWRQSNVTGPSARDHVAMEFDAARQAVVMHGGGMADHEKQETWTFNGRAWTRASVTGPARRYARLVHDSRARSMLLYGGFDRDPSNQLWRFDRGSWALVR